MAVSFLSMMESKFPPGFRFHPRDEELISDYLAKRITGAGEEYFNTLGMMEDVDLNKIEPWDLPDNTCVGGKEWYFFSLRDRKYATGQRTNRATLSGYWKATGKDRQVTDGRKGKGGRVVGMRKTLVFYRGRAPKGKKTDWVMHEFRMELDDETTPQSSINSFNIINNDWVLCRVFYKTRGHSPKEIICHVDDTTSSSCPSLPPLIDTYINFEQPPASISSLTNNTNLQCGFNHEQVPCFSNNLQFHQPQPLPAPPVPRSSTSGRRFPADATSLWSTPPLTNFAFEKKPIKAAASTESSDAFFGAHSIWNPF